MLYWGKFFIILFMDIHENWCTMANILIYATNYVADHLVKAREREVYSVIFAFNVQCYK